MLHPQPQAWMELTTPAAAGFQAAIDSQYYLGWGFKLTRTINNNAIFQWKSYGSPMAQNFPLVMKMVGGQLQLHYFPPGGRRCRVLVAVYFSQHVA
jgi:hypothetical protein